MSDAQKRLRELRDRQSKERGRMAQLAIADDLTEETRAELDTIERGVPDLERQLRAAQISVEAEEAEQRASGEAAEGDAEDRELRELRAKVKLSSYVAAAIEQRSADGAESEYNQARGIAGNRFPLEILAPVEHRATTDTDTTTIPRRWLDRLFSGTAAEKIGVTMESVAAGVASYPVTTAGSSAAQRAKGEAAADTAWTIGITELKPKRNVVRLGFGIEDSARIPGLESALNRELRMALTEGIDRAIFIGDSGATGTEADIVGFQTVTGLTEKTITQTNKVKGSNVLQAFSELIDGKTAMTPADLKTVLAVGANTLWAHQLANTGSAVDTTIAEFLSRFGLSWVTRGDIEIATDNGDFGGFVGLGRGLEGSAVAAVWEAGELIRDPYSGAAKGEIALTLCYLWSFGLPRASNFARIKFVT